MSGASRRFHALYPAFMGGLDGVASLNPLQAALCFTQAAFCPDLRVHDLRRQIREHELHAFFEYVPHTVVESIQQHGGFNEVSG